jgi:formylglycine-generating enzyme required for sulfatase activity
MSFSKSIIPAALVAALAAIGYLQRDAIQAAPQPRPAPATLEATTNAPSPGPVAGSPWTLRLRSNDALEMLPVAAGSFTMGSPSSEPDRGSDEAQHRVRITRPYWLGKYEVTQAQWQAVMGRAPSRVKGALRPVENVSWDDAVEFCAKLTNQERAAGRLPAGYRYTLPTEAEWEYACRAGTTTPFSTGNNLTTYQANYDGNYPYTWHAKGKNRKATTNVGSFPANAWGFYDMHGNVEEWCRDWYKTSPAGGDDPYETSPAGGDDLYGSGRVSRGGSWFDGARYCRSAGRGCVGLGGRSSNLGFRLALRSVAEK